jgi:hypothetical protein
MAVWMNRTRRMSKLRGSARSSQQALLPRESKGRQDEGNVLRRVGENGGTRVEKGRRDDEQRCLRVSRQEKGGSGKRGLRAGLPGPVQG